MTSPSPLVSVVMPSFNQAPFLQAAMDSVFSQDYPNIELIVRDGGSTDGSVEILKRNSNRIASWTSQKDRGQCDAINQGFALSSGEILCWLNSDDLFEPGAISTVVGHFLSNPEAQVVTGACYCVDRDGGFLHADSKQPLPAGDSADSIRAATFKTGEKNLEVWYRDWFPQSSTFWRRRLWELSGALDETLNYSMDYELWRRMARHSPIDVIDRVLSRYRYHADAKCILSNWGPLREVLAINRRDMDAEAFAEFAEGASRWLIDRLENREQRVGQLTDELRKVRESRTHRLGRMVLAPVSLFKRRPR